MTLVNINPDNTGIASNNPVLSANELAFRALVANAVNNTNTVVNEAVLAIDAVETGDYIRYFDETLVSNSTNTLVIQSNAVTLWDESAQMQITGWGNKTLTSLTNSNSFYIWATFVSGVKDYEATNITASLPSNLTEKFLVGVASVNGGGTVTFTKVLSTPAQQISNYWKQIQYCLNGLSVKGNLSVTGNLLDVTGGSIVPTGTIFAHASSSVPTGWLECNGGAISRTTYSNLFSAISTTWGVGDGSTTFNLPDFRGEFLRGWDNSRGIDSGRTFASYQADDFKSHNHTLGALAVRYGAQGGNFGASYSGGDTGAGSATGTTDAQGGTETRPRNKSVLYIIKY